MRLALAVAVLAQAACGPATVRPSAPSLRVVGLAFGLGHGRRAVELEATRGYHHVVAVGSTLST